MKYSAILSILFFLLTACSQDKVLQETGDAIIKEAELTSYEENIVKIMNTNSFVYDIELVNEEVTGLRVIVDYYENSVLINSVINFSTTLTGPDFEDVIRAVIMRQTPNESQEVWTASFITSNGYTSSKTDLERKGEMSSSAWGGVVNSPTPLLIGEKKVIASVVNTNKNMISSTNIKTEEELKEAIDYEQVYIVSIELI